MGPDEVRAQVAELLGTHAAAVDPDADLVAQGLDSIRMMSLAGQWRRRGLDVDFAALAAEPTVAAWTALVSGGSSAALPSAAPDSDDESAPFPLAPMQHAMWVGRDDDVTLGGVAGHLYVEFQSSPGGPGLDPARLAAAADALAARHPMLRVEFLPDGTQQIRPDAGLPVAVADLRGLKPAEVQQRLAATRETKSHQQLDGAVFELTVSLLPDGTARLHVDLDMQAADAMSYRTLMADLATAYQGTALAELGYTYRQYRHVIAGRVPDESHRQWWTQRIPDLPDPPKLPQPAGLPADPRRSTRRWHWLDPDTRDALFGQARAHGVTPAMTLAASFCHTLACWSGGPRFLLNVPLFGREPLHDDVDRLVGDFTSSLLLDVDLSGALSGTARAHAVQDAMRTAAAHADYPGLAVLRDLGRHRGTQVLAPVVFTSALGLGELFAPEVTQVFGTPVWIISQGPQVLLDAQVTEFDGGVLVNWDVREELFAPGVIDAMFAHHIADLTRLAGGAGWAEPAPAALPAAQAQVRAAVNAGTAEPSGETLQDGFFRRATRDPGAVAVLHDGGELSYGELRDQALAVAAALRDRGVRSGDTVALLGPKGVEQIPALLGILAAGAVYLPIAADQPRERLDRILDLGGASVALVTGESVPALPIPALSVRAAVTQPGAADPVATDPSALAYVVFTSGSTGEPKGVELTHDAAMNTVETLSARFGFGPDDRSLALLTLDADMSVLDVFAMLRAGGAIVMVDETDRRSPEVWARLVRQHRVSVLNLMPGALEMLVALGGELPSVRAVLTGGDWVRPELARRFQTAAPGVRFAGLGGATETAIHATVCEVDGEPPADWASVPYGTPLPNIACRVVGADGTDRPDWVAGELWVAGRGIASGYRGRPDLTVERFVEHDGRTWYRTGDLARYRPGGILEFVGRADHRVKISGYRIELGEVEAALRRLPGVAEAVVVGLADGAGREVLAAAVRADDPGVSVAGLRAGLAEALPEHMIPRQLVLVPAISYTVSGKIDRRAVTAELAAVFAAGDGYREPATPLQRALAAIVAEVLGTARVGADDDFFALGGDSVLATTAVARIRTWLDAPGTVVADIFAARTVVALADRLNARESDPGRLDAVAEVYLEVAQLDSAEIAEGLDAIARRA
ncbi:phenyloxazoline synthase MbtB [Mycolicibacter terrae]|uniref:Phenyloxazoline synthase MbtB n=1 Tax=Mycolicibacter terrae TaxID=1788 RepID=A0AAD1HX68_9MYCO|nr:non-ribosomal peptide synthetase [Mycolicibacter terrae]ORW96411.1 non-ribosomal peptide synthetase [Mycolicibacter terrae]BBX23207.1 phenyloxazoline synthase MbtB [Mycolicibacter terrae]SNV66512.1 phenyloxazoline synthase mbtB [Mycolicibacter terrae]